LPGAVVGQLEHFPGAVFQGIAAAHRWLETELAQLQAQLVLALRLAAEADDALIAEQPQLAAGPRVDRPGHRRVGIEEGEGGAVPGDVLHAPAAQVEAAVHMAAQGQARARGEFVARSGRLGWWDHRSFLPAGPGKYTNAR
jgi:hypothetical protein